MGAAFEVNKQMCDIEKDLSEAGYFRKICEGQIEARKKLIDMEKKKMTKAEAFEYLKNAKIYVGCKRDAVLRKLFEIGLEWSAGGQEVDLGWDSGEVYGLLSYDGKLRWARSKMVKWFDSLAMPRELRADDVLSIEIVEDDEPLDKWDDFARRVAKIQETLKDDEVTVITKTNFITLVK
jgi:hypothetical protein